MKLIDLFEKQRIIKGNINVPLHATELDYEGAIIEGSFECSNTNIASLTGAPARVDGNFDCSRTNIASLEGAPNYVGDSFICSYTKIISLEGIPNEIGGDIICSYTNMTTLRNIHKIIKRMGQDFYLPGSVRSHVLGVMFIKGLMKIHFIGTSGNRQPHVMTIINKHLKGNRDPHECQEELIDAGFSEYAKL